MLKTGLTLFVFMFLSLGSFASEVRTLHPDATRVLSLIKICPATFVGLLSDENLKVQEVLEVTSDDPKVLSQIRIVFKNLVVPSENEVWTPTKTLLIHSVRGENRPAQMCRFE